MLKLKKMNKREAQELSDKVITALKNKRLKKDISRYQISKETGMSQSSLSYIESLTQKPALYSVFMICESIGTDLKEILSEIEKDKD